MIQKAHNSSCTETISEREKEIIVCLVQGMSNKEIANHLIGPLTIDR